jgi:hypothetical protein
MIFAPAKREQLKLRMALIGPTGAGKTVGALTVGTALGKVALVDSENGRAKQFADRFSFDHANIADTTPEGYSKAIQEAQDAGYEVLIIDGLSPEWQAVLADADRFGAWKNVRPRHNAFVKAIQDADLHLIVTMRAKMKYSVVEVEEGGRKKQLIEPQGIGPIQDENLPYEFDVVAYIDREHNATFVNRCEALVGQIRPVDTDTAQIIVDWLGQGEPFVGATDEELAPLLALIEEMDKTTPHEGRSWLELADMAAQRDYGRPLGNGLTAVQVGAMYESILAVYNERKEAMKPEETKPAAEATEPETAAVASDTFDGS